MKLSVLLAEQNLSIYECAKRCNVPYTTMSELIRGKTNIGKCAAETVYKLAKILGMTVEDLLLWQEEVHRSSFETYKSNVCHEVKDKGDLDFIIETLQSDEIRELYEREWYPEAFYLLAMLDHLSKENGLPICTEYDDLRKLTLQETIYPSTITLAAKLSPDTDWKQECLKAALPEFLRYNIVESEIRNVC